MTRVHPAIDESTPMDRQFDYEQRILVAVEIGDAPRLFPGMPASYTRFKRLTVPDVIKAF